MYQSIVIEPFSILRTNNQALRPISDRWRTIGVIVVVLLFGSSMAAVEPLLLKNIFDSMTTLTVSSALLLWIAALIGLAVVRELTSLVANRLTWKFRLGLQQSLLDTSIRDVQQMPLHATHSEGSGGVVSALDRSINGLIQATCSVFFQALPAVFYLVLSVVLMMQLDYRLALVALAMAPLPAIIRSFAIPAQMRRQKRMLRNWSRIYTRLHEVLRALATVRSFAMETSEQRRFIGRVASVNRVVLRGINADGRYGAVSNLTISIAHGVIIALGALLVTRGEITVGTVIAFMSYTGGLFGPVQSLMNAFQSVATGSVALEELGRLSALKTNAQDRPTAQDAPRIRGDVEFRAVKFHYGDENAPILRGIDLSVRRGETVAVLGPSGAGKTTLMYLLARFYDPTSGAVLIDGVDIRCFRQDSIRSQIGLVLQDPLLFKDTIRNNILYGAGRVGEADLIAAAKLANAHDFISQLPNGYQTAVGESGALLSGGQRQRIAIARALVRNPAILILDEATAALDPQAEEAIREAMIRLKRGRTTFIIAHRMSMVAGADRIVVLRDGLIAETGSHAELMAAPSHYRSLVERHIHGFSTVAAERQSDPQRAGAETSGLPPEVLVA